MGREIQSQSWAGAEAKVIVGGKIYDDVGRLSQVPKPFPKSNSSRDFITTTDLMDGSQNYYPEALDYAYSAIQYYDDPLGRVKATGAEGKKFALDESSPLGNANGHPSKSWFFGVTGTKSPEPYFTDEGFIKPAYLNTTGLETTLPNVLIGVYTGISHYLTVTMDPDGRYTQQIKDIFGNLLRTISGPDKNGDYAIANYDYDITGKILTEDPPGAFIGNTTYQYNTLGQLVSKYTPDANTVIYEYDDAGRLLTFKDANHSADNNKLIYYYDDLGRNYLIIENKDENGYFRTRFIYDDPSLVIPYLTNSNIPASIITDGNLTNTRGRLVATISYDEDVIDEEEESAREKVIDLYSYDEEGRVAKKYKSIRTLPLQTFKYEYDLQGKISADIILNGAIEVSRSDYWYNQYGQLKQIDKNGKAFVTYTYDAMHKLTNKFFIKQDGTDNVGQISYQYNIRDWTKKISFGGRFTEELRYDNASIPQYNGNVGELVILQTTSLWPNIEQSFSYDKLNRLTDVHNYALVGSNSHPGVSDDDMDAHYTYDVAGRIAKKNEGLLSGSSTFNNWGNYEYQSGKNRLLNIASSTRAKSGDLDNYIYDANGNMIVDRSKKMTVQYDYRNLPIRFSFFSDIPETVNNESSVRNLESNPSALGVTRSSFVRMTYDAGGNRVLKREYK